MKRNNSNWIILTLFIITTSCGNDSMQCLENLENATGKTMPSFTECKDQYTVNGFEVFYTEMNIKQQKEFTEKHQFVNICKDTTTVNLSCKQKVNQNLTYMKNRVKVNPNYLYVCYWDSYKDKVCALADMKNGSIWFVIK